MPRLLTLSSLKLNTVLKTLSALGVSLTLLFLSAAASAAPAAPFAADDAVRAALPQASIVGQGKYTWFGIHVYDAALFTDSGKFSEDKPFALKLRYARDFAGAKIAESSISEIGKQSTLAPEKRELWQGKLTKLFPDVKRGDTLTGVYRGDGSAAIYKNGQRTGVIEDAALTRAFFAIWLDAKTSAPNLRAQLLGLKQ
jgi:hypothetical protein